MNRKVSLKNAIIYMASDHYSENVSAFKLKILMKSLVYIFQPA